MNTRSLKFQLIGWYAVVLIAGFGLLGAVTYVALQGSLAASLKENQLRRARQIAQLLRDESLKRNEARVGEEVQARYAPELNERFVRITRADGVMLYLSAAPKSQSFDPATLPPPQWSEAPRERPRGAAGWRPKNAACGPHAAVAGRHPLPHRNRRANG